jgi:hypothetical protein
MMAGQGLEPLLLALAAFLITGAFIGGVLHDWRKRLKERRKYREVVFRRFGIITSTSRATTLRHATDRVERGERLVENGPEPPPVRV